MARGQIPADVPELLEIGARGALGGFHPKGRVSPGAGLARSLYYGGGGNPTSIARSALDGTGATTVVSSAGFVEDLEFDVAGGKVTELETVLVGGRTALLADAGEVDPVQVGRLYA